MKSVSLVYATVFSLLIIGIGILFERERDTRAHLHALQLSFNASLDEQSRREERFTLLKADFDKATDVLVAQNIHIALCNVRWEEITAQGLGRRIDEYQAVTEKQWRSMGDDVEAARSIAESAREEINQVERNMVRDEDRMWVDLVAPSVQVMGKETVGSGILFPSQPVKGTKLFRTYTLTAWHVVRDLQMAPDDLSFCVPVTLYNKERQTFPETATVVKYDAGVDVALLLLNTDLSIPWSAKLASPSKLKKAHIFDRVYAVGCPLGNEPIPTFGEISDTHHFVDGSCYWMINAPAYIGNSGGGIFDAKTHELIGMFSKVYTHGMFRPTVITHMGLATPLQDIYDWFDRVGYGGLRECEEIQPIEAALKK